MKEETWDLTRNLRRKNIRIQETKPKPNPFYNVMTKKKKMDHKIPKTYRGLYAYLSLNLDLWNLI